MTDSPENIERAARASDDSSELEAALRRIGTPPYRAVPAREKRDALIERRRAVHHALRALEGVERRADRLRIHLQTLDAELREQPDPRIAGLPPDAACDTRWEDMLGGSLVRRCGRCGHDVFDAMHMSSAEIEALLAHAGASAARLRRRPDGRVVSAECGRAGGVVRRLAVLAAIGIAAGALAGAAVAAALPVPAGARSLEHQRSRAAQAAVAPVSDPGVRAISEDTWEIDRALLDRVLDGTVSLSRTVRSVPAARGGRIRGVQVVALRRGDLLSRLGIRSGDTLVAVNGHSLGALAVFPDALELRDELRRGDTFAVLLERAGRPRIQVYRVIDRELRRR